MGLSKPIAEFDTVKTWGEGLRKQWGGDPLAEEPEMIEALRDFCDFAGEDPDSIIARLFRIRKEDGERVLSVKWRRHYADKIKEFRARGDGKNQRRGADVLSFLIHNGVLIQG
jgi:hypothetical protein